MSRAASIVLILATLSPAVQSQQNPAFELKGKTVVLRNADMRDKLSFDAQGNADGKPAPGPFALSAIEVKDVEVSDRSISIKGNRALLLRLFSSDSAAPEQIRPLPMMQEHISIKVALDPADPSASLHKVFAFSPAEALAEQTSEQKERSVFSMAVEGPLRHDPTIDAILRPSDPAFLSHSVTPPRLIRSVEPEFPPPAQRPKDSLSGFCVVDTVVDENGFPLHERVDGNASGYLKENAMIAAAQYRFKPAEKDGKSLPVRIRIMVNFR